MSIVLLVLCSASATAEDRLHVVSRVSLPADMQTKLSWGDLRAGCESDGTITVGLEPENDDPAASIVKLSPNGAVVARVLVEQVAGFERAVIHDFAPGPNRETYVLVSAVKLEELKRDDSGRARSAARLVDLYPTLLRFDATGQPVAKHRLERPIGAPRLAVYASGDALIVRWTRESATRTVAVAGLFTATGAFLAEIHLPESLTGPNQEPHHDRLPLLTPFNGMGDEVLVFKSGNDAVVAGVSNTGEVSTTVLSVPVGFGLFAPRLAGDRLVGSLEVKPTAGSTGLRYAEFDMETGEVITTHYIKGRGWKLGCSTPNGMSLFNVSTGTLNIVKPTPPSTQ
ncbi:MAG: hypothetical protein WBM04_06250 [Candidatus Korobacteraceae bacterium]